MTDEEYVRAHFPDSHELEGRYGTSLVWLDKDAVFVDWAAAAKFTWERLKQIQQLEAEINYLCAADYSDQHGEVSNDADEAQERTRSRLADALADLRKGMA